MWKVSGVDDGRMHVLSAQLLSALEALQLDEKVESLDFASKLANQMHGGGCRAAGGEKIVYDEYPFSHSNRIAVNGQGAGPILEVILDFENIGGEFSRLPDRYESGTQPHGEGSPKNKPARLDADDFCNALVGVSVC